MRRNYATGIKAEMVAEAIREEWKLVELSEQFNVHPSQVAQWKRQLQKIAVFGPAKRKLRIPRMKMKSLYVKVGKLERRQKPFG